MCSYFLVYQEVILVINRKYRLFLIFMLDVICALVFVAISTDKSSTLNFKNDNYISADLKLESYNKKPDSGYGGYSASVSMLSNDSNDIKVIPSGMPIGIYVKTKGVMVIGIGEIKFEAGKSVSPCKDVIMPGDYIVKANDVDVNDKATLIEQINKSNGRRMSLLVNRNNSYTIKTVKPVMDEKNKPMLGLWVKDDIAGIGTLTYIAKDGFGALGHSITDKDTGELFEISDGAIYNARLINIVKADGENPGRLEGILDYSAPNIIGRVNKNSEYGISGSIKSNISVENSYGWMEVAQKTEVRCGEAQILSAVSGVPCLYTIEIKDIDLSKKAGNKAIEIEIKDDRLINITSGIVQGMSGTPILQNGKVIGAITHVFLKNPRKGYGTFLIDMINS